MARRRESGFSLIELMFALALGSIISATFYMTMFTQQQAYLRQLDNIEAQQNARAALGILKTYVRRAGWGFASSSDLVGAAPVGGCSTDVAAPSNFAFDCDNIDSNGAELTQTDPTGKTGGSDRMRVVFGLPTGFSEHPGNENTGESLSLGDPASPPGHPLTGLALASGACAPSTGNAFGADVFTISGTFTNYAMSFLGGAAIDRGCPPNPGGTTGYADGFGVAAATVVDFFIDRATDARHPRLMMQVDPETPTSALHVIAYDIDDLQVQYGLDVTNPDGTQSVDRAVDVWCDDPRPPPDANCDTGLTRAQNLARIIAVRVAVLPRTRNYKEELDYLRASDAPVSRTTLLNHTLRRSGDGYTRWIYRSTVALRNRDLR